MTTLLSKQTPLIRWTWAQKLPTAHCPSWGYLLALLLFAVATTFLVYVEIAYRALPWWRWSAIMVLSWWLPGLLLLWRWAPPGLNLPLAGVMALGVGWCWQNGLLVLMHWLPGPLPYELLVGSYATGTAGLLVLCWRRPFPLQPIARRVLLGFLLLTILVVLLRVPELGYHEFHQDETHLLRRANEALRGGDDALARHTKGIGEIAAVMVVYRALHTIDEGTARLPFALSSIGASLALAVLGMRLFNHRTGLVAGALLAFNGFALGLSRIAQYQGVVLLLSILAVLAMWEFYRQQSRVWLGLALVLSAFGTVMHYEFLLNALPLALLLLVGWYRANRQQRIGRTVLVAGAVAVVVVAVAYLPLLLNPYFATTRSYLGTRVADFQANNFAFFLEMATFYNSIYFVVGLTLLLGSGILIGLRYQRWQTLLLVGWFLPAALLYLLIVQYPGTHFYFLMPSWSLLAAVTLVTVDQWLRRSTLLRWSRRGLVLIWLLISLYYLYLLFFRQSPAYLVNYPDSRLPLYWAPYGEQLPAKPRFGFPIQQGWKTLGLLAEWNYLDETYASNERSDALRWYLRNYDRRELEDDPALVFVARYVQEPDPNFDDDRMEARGYQRIGEVQVRDEPQITLWARNGPSSAYLTYDALLYERAFDQDVPALREGMGQTVRTVDETLAETLMLKRVRQSCVQCKRGEVLQLALDWQVNQPPTQNYKLFVHITDATQQPVAQWDGLPGQNTEQTASWQAGEQKTDHVLILLPTDLSRGPHALWVGFYDPATGERLGGQAIKATEIQLR